MLKREMSGILEAAKRGGASGLSAEQMSLYEAVEAYTGSWQEVSVIVHFILTGMGRRWLPQRPQGTSVHRATPSPRAAAPRQTHN